VHSWCGTKYGCLSCRKITMQTARRTPPKVNTIHRTASRHSMLWFKTSIRATSSLATMSNTTLATKTTGSRNSLSALLPLQGGPRAALFIFDSKQWHGVWRRQRGEEVCGVGAGQKTKEGRRDSAEGQFLRSGSILRRAAYSLSMRRFSSRVFLSEGAPASLATLRFFLAVSRFALFCAI
jgi:hypothetical protein